MNALVYFDIDRGIHKVRAGSSLFFPAQAHPMPLIFQTKLASGYQIYLFKPNLSLKCYIFLE